MPRLRYSGTCAALVVLLYGCAKPPEDEGRQEMAAPAAAPAVRPPPTPVVRRANLEWGGFEATDDQCVATARAGGTSLQVTVRRDTPIRLLISLGQSGPARAPIRFSGSAGSWQTAATQAGNRQLASELGSGETALSRVLVLLNGGTMEIGTKDQMVSLSVPPSEAKGQRWFDCARATLS